jgi:mono/diheme cytochrome c family protein
MAPRTSSAPLSRPPQGPVSRPPQTPASRRRLPWLSLLACAAAASLCGCGGGARTTASSTTNAVGKPPSYASEPFSHQQQLIAQGARLFVSDGCSACHSIGARAGVGPSFTEFAGHRVVLADGRHVLVNEGFLREALLDPRATQLRGYPLAPMLAAVTRLQLARHRADVTALAAFIEEVGPEDG